MKAKMADRLIGGLSSEFERWTNTIADMTKAEGKKPHVQNLLPCLILFSRSFIFISLDGVALITIKKTGSLFMTMSVP